MNTEIEALFEEILPDDRFKQKRINNFKTADSKEIIASGNEVIATAFINKILLFPFVTWVTNRKYMGNGYATKCLNELKKRNGFLFAKVQKGNTASYNFAIKNNFIKVARIPSGTIMLWEEE